MDATKIRARSNLAIERNIWHFTQIVHKKAIIQAKWVASHLWSPPARICRSSQRQQDIHLKATRLNIYEQNIAVSPSASKIWMQRDRTFPITH